MRDFSMHCYIHAMGRYPHPYATMLRTFQFEPDFRHLFPSKTLVATLSRYVCFLGIPITTSVRVAVFQGYLRLG